MSFQRDFEVSRVPGRGLTGKGKHSKDIEGAFHVLTMEFEGEHHAGGSETAIVV